MTTAPRVVPAPLCPSLLASVVAQSMAYDPDQVADAAWEQLATGSEDRILELGCGSGRLLFQLAARARHGSVVGLDPSDLMVRHARHRNRRWIAAGRAVVEQGGTDDLARFAKPGFERVVGVHVVCFWKEPERDLAQVRRVLKPGGLLLLGFRPETAADPGAGASVRMPIPRVEGWLRTAGFTSVNTSLCGLPRRPLAWVRARCAT